MENKCYYQEPVARDYLMTHIGDCLVAVAMTDKGNHNHVKLYQPLQPFQPLPLPLPLPHASRFTPHRILKLNNFFG